MSLFNEQELTALSDRISRSLFAADLSARAKVARNLAGSRKSLRIQLSTLQLAEGDITGIDRAARFLERQQIMSPEQFAQLEDGYKASAFSIAGTRSVKLLNEVQTKLIQALDKGQSFDSFFDKLSSNAQSLGRRQLTTVYRNKLTAATQTGLYETLNHPAIKEEFPFYEYNALDDGRTRPTHRAMDGKIFRSDHPIWRKWWPPNGHGCRCEIRAISRDEAAQRGLVEDDVPQDFDPAFGAIVNIAPDRHFDGWPGHHLAVRDRMDVVNRDIRNAGLVTNQQGFNPHDATTWKARNNRYRALVGKTALKRQHADIRRHGSHTITDAGQQSATPDGPGGFVEWSTFSQSAEVQENMLSRLALDGFDVQAKIIPTAAATRIPDGDDPEAWTATKRLGVTKRSDVTVTRSTQATFRFNTDDPDQLDRLANRIAQLATQDHDDHIPGARQTPDIRVAGFLSLPNYRRAYLWIRTIGGKEVATLYRSNLNVPAGTTAVERWVPNQLWQTLLEIPGE